MPRFLLVLSSLFVLGSPDPSWAQEATRIVDLRTGADVTASDLVRELARHDAVFLGEEHDNAAGHRLHHELLRLLLAERPDLLLSMEMFERDVQGVVDDYVAGRIEHAVLVEHSRPWSAHEEFYRPFLEFARSNHIPVVAGNVPREIARRVAKGEEPTLEDRRFLPRTTTAPADRYRELFVEAMGGHAGTGDPGAIDRYYASQCLKDDAMAEAIVDALAVRPHERRLAVHVCGRFHSDHGLGTVARLLARRPLMRVAVVSMEAVENVAEFDPKSADTDVAHWLLVVPKPPDEDAESSEAEDGVGDE